MQNFDDDPLETFLRTPKDALIWSNSWVMSHWAWCCLVQFN